MSHTEASEVCILPARSSKAVLTPAYAQIRRSHDLRQTMV